MTAPDLIFDIALRAKELANMKMPDLKRAADYEGIDLGDHSRGAIIEAVLIEEFEGESNPNSKRRQPMKKFETKRLKADVARAVFENFRWFGWYCKLTPDIYLKGKLVKLNA